jgi:hypothetical protein
MIADRKTIDRVADYAKSLGLPGDGLGIKSTVQEFTRVKAGETGYDYIAIANTVDIDLEDEVVRPDGADKTYLEANRMMFADHNYGTNDVVGKIRAISRVYGPGGMQTAWKVRFRPSESTEVGRTTKALIEELGGIGVSIGFIAQEYGAPTAEEKALFIQSGETLRSVVRAWKWFELSTTALPANKSCQTQGMVVDEKYAAEVERLVTKGVVTRQGASRLGLPITPERTMFPVERKRIVLPDGTALIRRVRAN